MITFLNTFFSVLYDKRIQAILFTIFMPFIYLLFLCFIFAPSISLADIARSDKEALIKGLKFKDDEGWSYDEQLDKGILFEDRVNSIDSLCNWYRITCNEQKNQIITLNLTALGILKLAPALFKITSLQQLYLDANQLQSLPPQIGLLKNLIVLSVVSNQLSTLPNEITHLKNLKRLNLNYNLLSSFPESIAELSNLESLLLNANQITALPKGISQLKNLSQLEFNTNWAKQKFNEKSISAKTLTIVNNIELRKRIHGIAVSISGDRTIEYDNFIELKNTATQSELLNLVEHPSPAVRGYAFWALTEYSDINLLPIVLHHLNDNQPVETFFGCLGAFPKTGDFFINAATQSSSWFSEQLETHKLPSSQITQLDHILINAVHDLDARRDALLRISPDPVLYPRIRELVIKEKIPEAWVALAKYKKEQDIPLILTPPPSHKAAFGDFIHQAIEIFPHADFFPYLKEHLLLQIKENRNNDLNDLYSAVASYQNQAALSLITTPISKKMETYKVKDHTEARFCAIKKYKNPLYDDFLWKSWDKKGLMSADTLLYLSEKDPQRAFSLVKINLQNLELFYNNNVLVWCGNSGWVDAEKAIIATIDYGLTHDRIFTVSELNKIILQKNYSILKTVLNKVTAIQDKSSIEPLFKSLQFFKDQDHNSYIKLVSQSLAKYNNKEIDQRLAAIAKQ